MAFFFQVSSPFLEESRGSYQADYLTSLTKIFQTNWFKIPLLGGAETAISLGIILGGTYHK